MLYLIGVKRRKIEQGDKNYVLFIIWLRRENGVKGKWVGDFSPKMEEIIKSGRIIEVVLLNPNQ